MLTCPKCLQSCLRAIVPDTLRYASLLQVERAPRGIALLEAQRRHATSLAVAESGQDRPSFYSYQKREERFAVERSKNLSLEKEFRWLGDPLKLADNTLDLLERNERDKALELVRYAGRSIDCAVSWNHIINYELSKGRITLAMKLYNEMKKRGQLPDAYTYTIILRGLADNAHVPRALEHALSVYNSMYTENSPTPPTTTHTNAVLKVCSRAGDLDALFGIAARLPSRGKGAPDNWTFTTILNAIRHAAWTDGIQIKDETEKMRVERRQRAVLQGRRMWGDIVGRWVDGDMVMDEFMVCAMGRLLLLGSLPQDCDDVLSLVEQTMDIPRGIPPIGDPNRKTHHTHAYDLTKSSEQAGNSKARGDDATPRDRASKRPDDTDDAIRIAKPGRSDEGSAQWPELHEHFPEFESLPPSSYPRDYARPGNNTLSLVLDACTRMHAFQAGQEYWGQLSAKIAPDMENYHAYLRFLRLCRASRSARDLITSMVTPQREGGLGIGAEAKTFRIAMSCCVRDQLNVRALKHGEQILTHMLQTLENPDIRTAEMFAELLKARRRERDWKQVLRSIEVLDGVMRNLRSLYSYGNFAGYGSAPPEDENADELIDNSKAEYDPDDVAEVKLQTRRRKPVGRLDEEAMAAIRGLGRTIVRCMQRARDYYSENMDARSRRIMFGKQRALEAFVRQTDLKAQAFDRLVMVSRPGGKGPSEEGRVARVREEDGVARVREEDRVTRARKEDRVARAREDGIAEGRSTLRGREAEVDERY